MKFNKGDLVRPRASRLTDWDQEMGVDINGWLYILTKKSEEPDLWDSISIATGGTWLWFEDQLEKADVQEG